MKHSMRLSLLCLLLLSFVTLASAKESIIRILHVNDFHGFAEPHKPFESSEMVGGAGYLASAIDRLRQDKPSLLLSAGDMIQGHTWANFSRGKAVVELMNTMKFDAMVLGNHEFDFGLDTLKKRISGASFPTLGANVTGMSGLKPYVLKKVGGVKVGILGVIAEDTPVLTNPTNVTGLTFAPVKETVERYLPELRRQADLVIVLSHIGHPADRLLASQVQGIDFIIGGHSHTRVVDPPVIGKTMILQAWEHGKALGILDVVIENRAIKRARGYLEEIRPQGSPEAHAEAIVTKYKKMVDSALNERVGETDADLDGENVRKRETNLGNLIADVVKETAGADAALINGGAIRKSIARGEIKAKDIYSAVPFDNYIVAIRLKGREILQALEHGLAQAEKGAGAFPQVAGMVVRVDFSAPAGSRIVEAAIGGKSIEPGREYTVATLDFVASGGDGYTSFGDALRSSKDYSIVGGAVKGEKLAYSDPGRWLRDLVIDYIKARNSISPQVEGRIVQVEKR
jgi:5'-nucleotidase / UDP-sugar diphosphatase